MNTEKITVEIKEMMAEWQKHFEEMRLQFSLGKMNAADSFEQYKKQMGYALEKLRSDIDFATDKAEEQAKELKAKIEQLRVQLVLGKADTLEAFREQREKIEAALHEVFVEGKSAYNHQFENVIRVFNSNAHAFKSGMEIMELQFNLARMEAREEAEKTRHLINEKMNEMTILFKEAQDLTMKNIEEWTDVVKENIEKAKTWMGDIVRSLAK
jgi:hypothetical protein